MIGLGRGKWVASSAHGAQTLLGVCSEDIPGGLVDPQHLHRPVGLVHAAQDPAQLLDKRH